MKKKNIKKRTYLQKIITNYNLSISIFLSLYIGIEFILKSLNLGCKTNGCTATIELVKFSEIQLLSLGLMLSLTLIITSLFKKKDIFIYFLYIGMIFETILFFYQIVSGLFCIFCFGVWITLFILTFLNSKEKINFISYILIIFIALNTLNFTKVDKNNKIIFQSKYTLLGYKGCPFCEKTKKYFKENNIIYKFIDIKKINASSVFKLTGFKGVPTLVIKENKNKLLFLENNKNIQNYFESSKLNKNKLKEYKNTILRLNYYIEKNKKNFQNKKQNITKIKKELKESLDNLNSTKKAKILKKVFNNKLQLSTNLNDGECSIDKDCNKK